MKCSEFQFQVLEDEVTRAERGSMFKHFLHCEKCQEFVETLVEVGNKVLTEEEKTEIDNFQFQMFLADSNDPEFIAVLGEK